MTYVYTVLGTTLAIIIAEITLNYGLGDKVKDLFLRLFHDANAVGHNAAIRLEARAAKIRARL